jgi:tetratricopeptide (TPR) repeat protein
MDCRKVLLPLVLATLTVNAGCQSLGSNANSPVTGLNSTPPSAAATGTPVVPPPGVVPVVAKETDGPKRQPKAATCVAGGQFIEREALAAPRLGPLEKQQMFDRARRAYQQALSIDPSYMPAYTSLAHLYVELGDNERAMATFQKGLQKNAKYAPLWFDLGMYHARNKEWDAAIQNLAKAVELEPENRQYGNVLGFCLARAGRYDDSLSVFSKSSGQAMAYYNVGRMLHHNNQDDLCREYLQQALRLNPQLAEAEQLLASLDNTGVTPASYQAAPAIR